MDSFINLDTLRNLTVPLAAGIVFILLSAFRYAFAEYWSDLANRISTVVLSIGLVELGVFLNSPTDASPYVAGVINGAIVALAVIKAKDAEIGKIVSRRVTSLTDALKRRDAEIEYLRSCKVATLIEEKAKPKKAK